MYFLFLIGCASEEGRITLRDDYNAKLISVYQISGDTTTDRLISSDHRGYSPRGGWSRDIIEEINSRLISIKCRYPTIPIQNSLQSQNNHIKINKTQKKS